MGGGGRGRSKRGEVPTIGERSRKALSSGVPDFPQPRFPAQTRRRHICRLDKLWNHEPLTPSSSVLQDATCLA